MAPSASVCDECGKKFKVFAKKKRCRHCQDVMCKACVAAHEELKHTDLSRSPRGAARRRRRQSLALLEAALEEEDVQFLSPVHAQAALAELRFAESGDLLDGVEDVENVSADEDEEEEEEEEEGEDSYGADRDLEDELLLGAFERRSTLEEERFQFLELQRTQQAVAAWATKEAAGRKQLRHAKRAAQVPQACRSLADFQDSDLFQLLYAVTATVVVWAAFALAYAAYMELRSGLARSLRAMF